MAKKPSVDEIKTQLTKCEEHYSGLQAKFEEDERFYELLFKDDLNIPEEFKNDRVVVSTARDVVDAAINHTDIMNARVFVNKKGTGETSKQSAEMLRKLALGLIHRTNVESSIAPGRVGAKHYWIYGLACYKTVWDADRWIDKPLQNEGESEDAYAKRIDTWRAETHLSLPIVILPTHPATIMPDPYQSGQLYVFEKRKKLVYEAKKIWSQWGNPNNKGDNIEIDHVSWWDKDYRCELVDNKPVLKIRGGVVEHKYGFIPYTLIESGLGNIDKDAKPETRYVGLLRYIKDLLISESTNYTLCDILMKLETMKGGYITGADAGTLPKIKQEYGKYWNVGGKDVQFHDWESKLAGTDAYQHLSLSRSYIHQHAAPKSVMGQGEAGVRSGADRRLVIAEAAAIYQYASPAFAHGWANILNKCARLAKNVIPGDFEIWTKTPTDEFDVVVKKNLLREPFNYYVQFSPISEEDEYRQHDDLMRRLQAGLIDPEYAWERQNDVDPEAMRKRMEKERLRSMPAYNQVKDQHMAIMFQQAAQEAGLMPMPPQGGGQVPQGQEGQGRGNVPPSPQRAQFGQARDNERLAQIGRPKLSPLQGMGGGGNRG